MSDNAEKLLAEAKKWIGRETPIKWGRYPVELEPIRRWCRMVDCTNPLYLDEEYARKTMWGGIICPPLLIPMFTGADSHQDWPPRQNIVETDITPPTPGEKSVGVNRQYEFFKVVRTGDRLASKRRLADVSIRPIKFDKEAFWITTEVTCFNQHMDIVATMRRTSVKYRLPEVKEKTPPEQKSAAPNQAGKIAAQQKGICFKDIKEGEEIPGYSLRLDPLRFHLQTSGTQFFGLMHLDEDYARGMGLPHIFLDAGFTQAALSRVITDWMGTEGWLAKFDMQMKRMNFLGDTLNIRASVLRKYEKDGRGYVECNVWAENQRDGISTPGKATFTLPLSS